MGLRLRSTLFDSIGNVPVYGGVTLDGCGYPCLLVPRTVPVRPAPFSLLHLHDGLVACGAHAGRG